MKRWGSRNQLETGVRLRWYKYTCLKCGEEEEEQLMQTRPPKAKYCKACRKNPAIKALFSAAYKEKELEDRMAITKKMSRNFKKENCSKCKLARKKDMKAGKPHCGYAGEVSIKNGVCLQQKI